MRGKRAAGFVIFRRINNAVEYLLLQTSYGTHHWTPPKGHVDPGESDEVTALRETKEEAGIDADDLTIYQDAKKVLQYPVNNKPKTVTYWLAQLKDPNRPIVLSHEHRDFKWLKLHEAQTIGEYEDTKELLRYCDNFIREKLFV